MALKLGRHGSLALTPAQILHSRAQKSRPRLDKGTPWGQLFHQALLRLASWLHRTDLPPLRVALRRGHSVYISGLLPDRLVPEVCAQIIDSL